MALQMIFGVIGGLGIFLLGMRYLSDGLQSIAGNTLRRLIALVTNNRVMAIIIGIVVTTIVQSSSITSVMVVAMVNSTVMTLSQAVGVLMGANIGTTITGWVLVLNIGAWGLPTMGFAAIIYLFSKNQKVKFVAQAFLGVGMVFFGLELMKEGFKPIRSIPEYQQWFHMIEATSYFNIIRIAFVGCILTVLVQSSSAVLAMTIGLASTGVITFETSAALILGQNIGTTITAFLASLGTTVNAKRTAYFHIFFNVFGTLIILIVFHPYLNLIRFLVQGDPNFTPDNVSFPYVTRGIAYTHTFFNVANTLIFLPFLGSICKFLEKYVHMKAKPTKRYLTHLDFQHY